MTLTEALQALHERLGNDPDCDCEDCTTDREIVAQLENASDLSPLVSLLTNYPRDEWALAIAEDPSLLDPVLPALAKRR